jgi:FkbM family methyltransferase
VILAAVENEIHVFDSGVRLFRSHISEFQATRYRNINLHEPIEEEWFGKLSAVETEPLHFADVGAGIGYYSILMKLLRPSARVFCFEPLREHAAHLAENLALNGIVDGSVRICDLAIADSSGQQPFHEENFGSRLLRDDVGARSFVQTTTLEAVVERMSGPLDLVKVDVQGDELRVIAGAGRALSQVRAWIVGTHGPEIHSACVEEFRRRGLSILFEDATPPHQPDGLIVAMRDGGPR